MISHILLGHKLRVNLKLLVQRQGKEALGLLKYAFCQFRIESLDTDKARQPL